MFSTAAKNRIGLALIAGGSVLGLFFSWKNDNAIEDVNIRQNEFIISQCKRDNFRNTVVIESLENAKGRAFEQFKMNPDRQAQEVYKIQVQINKFKSSNKCKLP